MSRRLLILFAILVIFSAAAISGRHGCPKNQVWDFCSTACPPTCKKPKPDICTLQCVIGCRCIKGLLRNEKGECIPPSECP
ncbi:chymotrypsin inhibitor-like [Hylaeus volcanicus]|uniref:chymotrypsin inhibitor-like n=1 Tax=Hylaeus volcanicus TaxID=313075 RepID=UPI0023B7F6DF|nr:chymotrypsin inhibitor-like [Hylaeus volcanicus]